ncbi:hypothetical protein NC651_031350 [Populus alba x Populus x berolinensis]|nr:hypothetical protein NC651_031350 [Populus alba x Populus x berolinensis]
MAIELEGIAPASGGEASPGKLTAWVFFSRRIAIGLTSNNTFEQNHVTASVAYQF